MVDFIPEKGDIVWINFEPQQGKEIQKTRPALVLTHSKYNLKSGLAIFVPITSQIKGYPFEVLIDFKQIRGAILCDQVRSMDWRSRRVSKITRLDDELLEKVLIKLRLLI
jgi:mRNA interferase MazF